MIRSLEVKQYDQPLNLYIVIPKRFLVYFAYQKMKSYESHINCKNTQTRKDLGRSLSKIYRIVGLIVLAGMM